MMDSSLQSFDWTVTESLHSIVAVYSRSSAKVVLMMCKWWVGWHFFHDWDTVTNEGHRELLLDGWKPVGGTRRRWRWPFAAVAVFISFAEPTLVFIYFCPSSGANETPRCRRGAWVMMPGSLKALHPAGHGSTSETRGKWMRCLRNLFIWRFYVNVCMGVYGYVCILVVL